MKRITFKAELLGNTDEYIVHLSGDQYSYYVEGIYRASFWLVKRTKTHLTFEFYLAKRMHTIRFSMDELIIEE